MYAGRDFDPSDNPESELYCFDFVNDLPSGATISAATWSCAVAAISEATDADAATRLQDSPINQGTKSFHRVKNLQPGVTYRLQAVVDTNQGDKISLWAHVECTLPGVLA